MFCKKGVLKNLQILQENTCIVVSCQKNAVLSACIFIKKDSDTDTFLRNLRKIQEQLF